MTVRDQPGRGTARTAPQRASSLAARPLALARPGPTESCPTEKTNHKTELEDENEGRFRVHGATKPADSEIQLQAEARSPRRLLNNVDRT